MTTKTTEYINPNKPFRFFRTFKRERPPGGGYPDFVSMPTEGLRKLAFALVDDPMTGPIFQKAGIHGDIGGDEEATISGFVERYVSEQGWEKPDPANLVTSTVLARQLAEGGIARDDRETQIEFIEDKRCDGLGLLDRKKPLKASEVIPILHWVERQDDLKASFSKLRGRTFKRGQSFFDSEEEEISAISGVTAVPRQMASHKYGFFNRDHRPLEHLISSITTSYIMCEVDSYDSKDAIDHILKWRFISEKIIYDLDDSGGVV